MSISPAAMSVSLFHHHIRIRSPCSISGRAPRTSFPPHLLCSVSASGSGEREESRWLREEQRWLREEQRWLREQQRWNTERESLLREISMLRLRIQQLEPELERRSSFSDSLSQIGPRLETTISLPSPQSDPLALSSSSSSSTPFPPAIEEQDTTVKEESVDECVGSKMKASKPPAKTLKVGSEGDEVRELQEALLELGFYSGEEDMEFSAFSSGTQRAVKTWQSSIGAPEDGIMTVELLKKLYSSQQTDGSVPLDIPNGAALASVAENTEIQQTAVKKEGRTDTYVSDDHKVFLLGENRWEEPSRLTKTDKQAGTTKTQASPTRCLTCRGEGRLLCTECDGTGEPNIEPQFMEWVEEGASCPYCEGQGYTTCDTCDGKPAV